MNVIPRVNVGEPAPWFTAATGSGQGGSVILDELAGRPIVLFFVGSAIRVEVAEVLAAIDQTMSFDCPTGLLLIVSNDPADFRTDSRPPTHAGTLKLLDADARATAAYITATIQPKDYRFIQPIAFVLNPALQVSSILQLRDHSLEFARQIGSALKGLEDPPAFENAPVLLVPRVFDAEMCNYLIDGYQSAGGREIAAIEFGGNAVQKFDHKFRRRRDWYVSDDGTIQSIRTALERRLLPMVHRAFQFQVTRIERYLVGCYDAHEGGCFRPHRDNTAPLVAHRRFALTINLNEDYEGGSLRFPEFGSRTFRSSLGDAIVFSCSLLHEVTPVTSNRRYAFLTFLYDETAERLREQYRSAWIKSQQGA
jgi:predicted 2-oxoglutarate/Fe(II)-dependent dioxygenase YbiX